MNLTQLEYFYAAAEEEHMTRAAQRLHVAQPSLTQAVSRLEQELGVPLFYRTGRTIRLSPYGAYLKQQLRPVLETLHRLPGALHAMQQASAHTIRLNLLAASTLATEAIINYKNARHDVHIQLIQNPDAAQCDVSISTQSLPAPCKDSATQRHFTEQIFLAVPKTGTALPRGALELRDLAGAGLDFISLSTAKSFRLITDDYCRRAGFHPNITFESDSPTAVRNCIAAGVGVGFWPQFTWGSLHNDSIRLVPLGTPRLHRDLKITQHRVPGESAEVDAFFTYLTDFFARKRALAQHRAPTAEEAEKG